MNIRTLDRRNTKHPHIAVAGHSNLTFTLCLGFEWWLPQPDDDPYTNFFNMQIHLSTRQTYALNVWTFTYLARLQQQLSDERLGGQYLVPPNLLVAKLNRPLLKANVTVPVTHTC